MLEKGPELLWFRPLLFIFMYRNIDEIKTLSISTENSDAGTVPAGEGPAGAEENDGTPDLL